MNPSLGLALRDRLARENFEVEISSRSTVSDDRVKQIMHEFHCVVVELTDAAAQIGVGAHPAARAGASRSEYRNASFDSRKNRTPARREHRLGGLFVQGSSDFVPRYGDQVAFVLHRGNRLHAPIKGIGVVRWIREPRAYSNAVGFGVEFRNLFNTRPQQLQEFINLYGKPQRNDVSPE